MFCMWYKNRTVTGPNGILYINPDQTAPSDLICICTIADRSICPNTYYGISDGITFKH